MPSIYFLRKLRRMKGLKTDLIYSKIRANTIFIQMDIYFVSTHYVIKIINLFPMNVTDMLYINYHISLDLIVDFFSILSSHLS